MGAYISGGLGSWELPFAAAGSVVAFRGLRSNRFIGIAWLMHSAWDLVAASSFGCCIFDGVIALWFVAGAPSAFDVLRRAGPGRRNRSITCG